MDIPARLDKPRAYGAAAAAAAAVVAAVAVSLRCFRRKRHLLEGRWREAVLAGYRYIGHDQTLAFDVSRAWTVLRRVRMRVTTQSKNRGAKNEDGAKPEWNVTLSLSVYM
ncbi:hypothetical protein IWX46DRAFT_583341 [Phyllosticta citricarpa]|uniref:Uncharacterized protein n=1 Tax=Phyllosticta citricarpa TaxID=55181 RepID=A0ABR1LU07_9PEZI